MVLLLAAGQSRRFGSDKRLYELNGGEPLALQTARLYLDAGLPVTPVIRPEDLATLGKRFVEAGTRRPIESSRAHLGMGYSLADAAAYLLAAEETPASTNASAKPDAIIIALADMPFVRPETIRALAAHGDRASNIVAPQLETNDVSEAPKIGNPVRFPWAMLAELRELSGDTGARRLFGQHEQHLLLMPTDDPGVLQDIDFPPS